MAEQTGPDVQVTYDVGTEVLFENHRVRMWKVELGPGEFTTMHRHVHDHCFVYSSPGLMEVEYLDDTPRTEQPSEEGLVVYREVGAKGLVPHRLSNVGETHSIHYLLEFLGPSASEQEQPAQDNREQPQRTSVGRNP